MVTTFEQVKGKCGLGELNEEFVNEQDEGDTDLVDSSDNDEDHFVEAYESKLSKILNSFESMKEKLKSKFNDAITNFPEKEIFRIFEEKMTNIIVEEKTKSKTLFKFPSNETGVKEVDYLLDSNEVKSDGIKNDGDNNKKEGETKVKEKDGKHNENDNDEEKKDDDAEETNNYNETIQQSENENMLDKVVDNIVDNVLGIGFSRSPITKIKTNTLISQVIQGK
uniref:Uncharacterized protein n=1 Tax=Lactuca sativa TaxID=4236 RepID=A0A9R1WZC4_LACSA|nr:hypothetical protein LSAT_V11C800444940 [Lactuca sativa]